MLYFYQTLDRVFYSDIIDNMETTYTPQIMYVFIWSNMWRDYSARMAAMSSPPNVATAFKEAGFLSLVPKE